MEWTGRHIIETSFLKIYVDITSIGNDLLIAVSGGIRPHIGCTIISVPRLSLKEGGKNSCTTSVWNLVGHKDEEVCRRLAEAYCKISGRLVVCTGGIHAENIQMSQIEELISKVEKFIQTETENIK